MIYELYILGSDGMLGKYIELYFGKEISNLYNKFYVIPINRDKFDVLKNDITYLAKILTTTISEREVIERKKTPWYENKLKIVINCIAKFDEGKKNEKDLYLINSIFPHKLSVLCKSLKYQLIHVSTNSVFSTLDPKNESSDTLFENSIFPPKSDYYSFTKALGEPNECIIIRTSIIGEEDKNKRHLIEKLKKISLEQKELNGFINDMWNGVTCLQFCKNLEILIYSKNKKTQFDFNSVELVSSDENRIFHFTSDIISKYELIKNICKVYNLNINIIPTDQPVKNLTLQANRKFNCEDITKQLEELKKFGEKYSCR